MSLILLAVAAKTLASAHKSTPVVPVQETGPVTYYCSYFPEGSGEPENKVDLVMIKRPKTETAPETWLLKWPDKPEYDALAFEAEFGSIGGSRGLRWKDENNGLHFGFISFSDTIAASGSKGLWFSLDKPSLWRKPGYGCETDLKMVTGVAA